MSTRQTKAVPAKAVPASASVAASEAPNLRRVKTAGKGKACEACDTAHAKCSRGRPACERCVARGNACVYTARSRGPSLRELDMVVASYRAECAPCAAAHRRCPGIDRDALKRELATQMRLHACSASIACALLMPPECTCCVGAAEKCMWPFVDDAAADAEFGPDSDSGALESASDSDSE